MWTHMSEHGWWFGLGALPMLLFWGLVILAVVVLVRAVLARESQPRSEAPSQQSRALDILKERYARGEIDKQEYEQKKSDIADTSSR